MSLQKNFSRIIFPAAVLVLSFVIYLPTLKTGFMWDDKLFVENDRSFAVQELGDLAGYFMPGKWLSSQYIWQGGYRPVKSASIALDHLIYGPDSPEMFHLTNILLNSFSCLMAYFLALYLLKDGKLAFISAALFTLHPARAEAVAQIKDRGEMLAFIFFSFSVIFFNSITSGGKRLKDIFFGVLAAAAFFLALSSSYTVIAYPAVLAALIYFRKRESSALVNPGHIAAVLFSVLALAYYLFVVYLFNAGSITVVYRSGISIASKNIYSAAVSLFKYISLLFIPSELNPDRGALKITAYEIFAVIILILLLVYLYRKSAGKKQNSGTFRDILFYFSGLMLPVINIVYIVARPISERRLYLPMAFFIMSVVFLLERYRLLRGKKALLFAPVSILACVYSFFLFKYLPAWSDPVKFWTMTVLKNPANFRARINLAGAYAQKKELEKAEREYSEADRLLDAVGREKFLSAEKFLVYYNLGMIHYFAGKKTRAEKYLKDAVEYDRYETNARRRLVELYISAKKYIKAEAEIRTITALEPWNIEMLNHLGVILKLTGRPEAGIEALEKAVSINPSYAVTYINLGNIYLALDRRKQARRMYEKAVALEPSFVSAIRQLKKTI